MADTAGVLLQIEDLLSQSVRKCSENERTQSARLLEAAIQRLQSLSELQQNSVGLSGIAKQDEAALRALIQILSGELLNLRRRKRRRSKAVQTRTESTESFHSTREEHQISQVRFKDVVGHESPKASLVEHVILPLLMPASLRRSVFRGIRGRASNVLLYGPPGTGKTCLVSAAANEANATLLEVTPSKILSKYHGESERQLRNIFQQARERGPTVIFVDEIDGLCTRRETMGDDTGARRLLSELLMQLNTVADDDAVVVCAATNRETDIDEAVLRRFQHRVLVGLPLCAERAALVRKCLEDIDFALSDEDFLEIANRTEGWSGSDIECLCRDVAFEPIRDAMQSEKTLYTAPGSAIQNIIATDCACLATLRPVLLSDFDRAMSSIGGNAEQLSKGENLEKGEEPLD